MGEGSPRELFEFKCHVLVRNDSEVLAEELEAEMPSRERLQWSGLMPGERLLLRGRGGLPTIRGNVTELKETLGSLLWAEINIKFLWAVSVRQHQTGFRTEEFGSLKVAQLAVTFSSARSDRITFAKDNRAFFCCFILTVFLNLTPLGVKCTEEKQKSWGRRTHCASCQKNCYFCICETLLSFSLSLSTQTASWLI